MSISKSAPELGILEPKWFTRPTCVVAADLVGKILCRQLIDSDGTTKILRMRISETEAYIGQEDGSVRAHLGTRAMGKPESKPKSRPKPKHSDIMYEQGGIFYIYLTYGVHHMLNLVSGHAASPESVLIRAGFLVEDSDELDDTSPSSKTLLKRLSGPGKLTKCLQIDRSLSGMPIELTSKLWIESDGCVPPVSLRPRIGIDYAGEAKNWLLRYVWTDHPSLSKK